jgi:hypothetical protein
MPRKEPTQAQFLKDVANHEMFIKLDQGVYRHIVFQQPKNSFVYRFEIVTTPWRLMITGDMGTWVFARLDDMFEFFRTDGGKINKSYWAEKLQNGTHGCSDAAKVYDGDTYKTRVLWSLDNYDLSTAKKRAIRRELQQWDFDDEHWIISQLRDFSLDGFQFQDIWEIDMKTYSYHFVWCCYAIAWAIQRYDAAKAEAVHADA